MNKFNRSIIFILVIFMLTALFPISLNSLDDTDFIDGPEETKETEETEPEKLDVDTVINNSLILKIGNCKALINGEIKQIDEKNPNVVPFIDENNRTLVPVRFIAENLGYEVEYDAQDKIITMTNDSDDFFNFIVMYINMPIIIVNREEFYLDTAPLITPDNRTVIPLRAFVEIGLKQKVAYINSEKIIIISDFDIDPDLAEETAANAKNKFISVSSSAISVAAFVYPVSYPQRNAAQIYFLVGDEGERYKSHFNPQHLAVDFNITSVNSERDIFAIYPGIVEETVESNIAYGNRVIIKHTLPNGTIFYSLYAHLAKIKVFKKASVSAGQIIGEMGSTGAGTGIHLHMTVWIGPMSKSPEQDVTEPTEDETITSTGKAVGRCGRIFYDIRKVVELQKLF